MTRGLSEESFDNPQDDLAEQAFAPNEFGPDTRGEFEVLKDGDLFAVFATNGDMNGPLGGRAELYSKDGLFFRDTRVLSRFVLSINDTSLVPMAVSGDDDGVLLRCDLANARLIDTRGREIKPYEIHISRERFLSDAMYERVEIANYGTVEADLDVVLDCYSDFRDIFEIRGTRRRIFGTNLPPERHENGVVFSYETTDGHCLTTDISFDRPVKMMGSRAHFDVRLPPGGSAALQCIVRACEEREASEQHDDVACHGSCDLDRPPRERATALAGARARFADRATRMREISSDRPEFDAWLWRSASDLTMLTAELPTGPYPHAGVPWFSVPFGRDGLIAALQTLWIDSTLAAGVLAFLAESQAKEMSVFRDSEPGKILHETRGGAMARTGEVPFERYYGGIDQTLLFVVLAGAYYRRTADIELIRRLAPAIDAALEWAHNYGDRDGDGFVEYERASESGLRNQGWKDSEDSIFHADGTLGEGAIALIEVQAYLYAALRAGADIAEALKNPKRGTALRARADDLRERIDSAFWDDELCSYCIGLDGKKKPIRVNTSNAGHVLFAGAALPHRNKVLAQTLLKPDIFTGWGVRTVAAGAARFNPMGYHNGSIWPHDNSLIAAGLARNGFHNEACRVSEALFHAAREFPEYRLPELWCGFDRSSYGQPVAYPSACSPQAWAAGAAFLCLEACLGLTLDALTMTVTVRNPVLPPGVDELTLTDIHLRGHPVTLKFCRTGEMSAGVEVLEAPPNIRVVTDIE
ncbi:amylo-alpha-1,6-glucosidase [Oricola cellulosilytica]|uniref:Amylo-alpha-1,6-glucosidase n=1 Tax=Oricola cellulosilytica TaxID=1429082 RepID=A0A4R0PD55_9HYPH|nr:glycogen debranching N-terminal domain-containing protein [Oricola cellulosilytica]TCD14473.1 amylo-alpha-1,6-glucosidase [Oricola cellulosilytica]